MRKFKGQRPAKGCNARIWFERIFRYNGGDAGGDKTIDVRQPHWEAGDDYSRYGHAFFHYGYDKIKCVVCGKETVVSHIWRQNYGDLCGREPCLL